MKDNEAVKLLEASKLFDAKWYMDCYPDVKMSSMPATLHYLRYGWLMLRDPSTSFSTSAYLEKNSDVKDQGVNPLVHYISLGKKEGRKCFSSEDAVGKNVIEKKGLKENGQLLSKNAVSMQLEKTQALLEHYFNRCKELEYFIPDHQLKSVLESK